MAEQKPLVDISPPDNWRLAEFLINESGALPELRFEQVQVTLKVDDLLRFFEVTLDDSLATQTVAMISGNRQFTEKEVLERVRLDDRLERLVDMLIQLGLSQKVVLQHIFAKRQEVIQKVTTLNEIVALQNAKPGGLEADLDTPEAEE